jgi:dTDP-6-deoxy-L-talose 4-dehydrogenase (NAD+)
MNILITGANGFIGSNLVSFLQKKKYNLFLISRKKDNKTFNKKKNIISITSDINFNRIVLKKLINFSPDVLIHLAWSGIPDYSKKNSDNNYLNQKKFFSKIYNIKSIKKILVTGSCSEHKDKEYLTSKHFAKAKIKIKNFIKNKFLKKKIILIWMRLFYVYGKNQNERSLIPKIIYSLKRGKEFKILKPSIKHDYINVSDVVNFINLNLKYSKKSYVCDLGSFFAININDIYLFIRNKIINLKTRKLKKYKKGFVAKKINFKYFNWQPKVSIEKGLIDLLK